MLTIIGSHGSFTVNDEGTVIEPHEGEYGNIIRVNIEELREWETKHGLPHADSACDILAVGYWAVVDGDIQYEPPEETHRGFVLDGCGAIVGNEALGKLVTD